MFVADVCSAHVWFHGVDYACLRCIVDIWRCQWYSLHHRTVIILYVAHSLCLVSVQIFKNISYHDIIMEN